MSDLNFDANFDEVVSFTADLGVIGSTSITVDQEVTETSSNPVASSGIYSFTTEKVGEVASAKEDKAFVCTYGTTSYADVLAAYNAGKQLILLVGVDKYYLTKVTQTNGIYAFEFSSYDSNLGLDSVRLTKTETGFSWDSDNHDSIYATKTSVNTSLATKQNTLVSGTNIKTINGQSVLGEGNLVIEGGSGGNVDDVLVNGTSVLGSDKVARVSIPTNVSSFTNDAGYITENDIPTIPSKTSELVNDSDYTTTEQVAGQLDLKQDKLTAGTNITISEDNVISATGGSGGSTVTMADNAQGGVDLTVDGTSKTLAKQTSVTDLNSALNSLNGDYLPSYYFDDDYISTKISAINSHDSECGYKGFTVAFITDTHWKSNSKKSPLLLKYLSKRTSLKNIVFGGDCINVETTKDGVRAEYGNFRFAFKDFNNHHWLPIIGNHELNNPSASSEGTTVQLSSKEAYALVTKENEDIINVLDEYSYYIDNDNIKIRFIFIGCKYTSQIDSNTQTVVINAINSLPTNYKIVVFSHIGFNGSGETGTIDSTLSPITDVLDTISDSVIAIFTGHRHADGKITTNGGIRVIATTTDSRQEDGGLPHSDGTLNEQAFDVIQYNPENGYIYCTRIGRGSDRVFTSKTYYGGLECGIDKKRYNASNGKYDDVVDSEASFVSVMVDSGTTTSKRIVFGTTDTTQHNCLLREFNDVNANSVDYWSINGLSRTITSSSRYFSMSMFSQYASKMFIYNETDGVYLLKGNEVE